MEGGTKGFFLIIVGALVFLIALTIFVSTSTVRSAPTESELQECKVLKEHGPGRINIVFFGSERESKKYVDFFLESTPFNEFPNAFNFYLIDKSDYQVKCEHYRNIALFCHSRELIRKAASCPNDFIVVLEEDAFQIRSSAYQGVMSINSAHLLTVFLHEFAHVFGDFAEEYINNQRPPRGSQNCQASCDGFGAEIDGCFEGCSQNSLHRSVDEGVMRTLSPSDKENPFGTFNANTLRDLIKEKVPDRAPVTGQAIDTTNQCLDEEYILVTFTQDTIEKTRHQGCAPTSQRVGTQTYQALRNGEVIDEGRFSPELFTDTHNEESGELSGETYEDNTLEQHLSLPAESEELIVLDQEGDQIVQERVHDAGAWPCPAV